MSKIFWTIFVVAWVGVLGVIYLFRFIEKKTVAEAKRLIMQDERFEKVFGEVQKVRLWPLGLYEWNDGRSNFPMAVKGSKQKRLVKVYCRKANDKVYVTEVKLGFGFEGDYTIWPEIVYPENGLKIPRHVCNGIWSILTSIGSVLAYLILKENGWLRQNILIKLYGVAMNKVVTAVGLSSIVWLILSFLYFTNIMYS